MIDNLKLAHTIYTYLDSSQKGSNIYIYIYIHIYLNKYTTHTLIKGYLVAKFYEFVLVIIQDQSLPGKEFGGIRQ